MSIEVSCPKGHSFKVKDNLAGKTGLCPVCKSRIKVPAIKTPPSDLSEDAILGIIGPYEPDEAALQQPIDDPATRKREPAAKPTKKKCEKCGQQVPVAANICPFCRTYMLAMKDLTKDL
jgi:hypothetical protein